ncbi:MAG: aspartate kinase [Clostridiales Family XIII bacterium]|nr:aspartate kinase [Clostridiales Family XIII bacterium]
MLCDEEGRTTAVGKRVVKFVERYYRQVEFQEGKMGVITAKFGGSSVADAAQIRKTKDIVMSRSNRRYVVVSGPGKRSSEDEKVTDLLYRYQGLAAAGDENGAAAVFSVIEERFIGLKRELAASVDIESALAKVAADLTAGASADYAASRGEFLNAQLIAAFYGYDFVDAAGLVLFDEDGNFLAEKTNAALSEELAKHERAVVPGFYGTWPDGSPKTFSRGGSDVTGALVARAVQADVYENWTDVSGFLMTDPRVVKNPHPIPVISYREQRELSSMGASVLHEDAVTPARLAGIPINIRNTNAPDEAGTMIVSDDAPEAVSPGVRGISGKKGYAALRVYRNAAGGGARILAPIFAVASQRGIQPDFALSAVDAATLYFADGADASALASALEKESSETRAEETTVAGGITLIAVVGNGVGADPGAAAKATAALAEGGIKSYGACFSVSETNLLVGVADRDYEAALNALYAKFS